MLGLQFPVFPQLGSALKVDHQQIVIPGKSCLKVLEMLMRNISIFVRQLEERGETRLSLIRFGRIRTGRYGQPRPPPRPPPQPPPSSLLSAIQINLINKLANWDILALITGDLHFFTSFQFLLFGNIGITWFHISAYVQLWFQLESLIIAEY